MSDQKQTIEQSVENPQNLRILEALLFASDEILTSQRLKQLLPNQPDVPTVKKMVAQINVQLQSERHPFEIIEVAGGFQFRTIAYYHVWVQQLFKEKSAKRLSVQALECLAIIAYKQPLSKAEIESIRGVLSDGAMKTLLERRLVTITGRSEKAGRPLLYGTTNEFLQYFGINKLSDLPSLEEFEALAKAKLNELSVEELNCIESAQPSEQISSDQISSEQTSSDQAIPGQALPVEQENVLSNNPSETDQVPAPGESVPAVSTSRQQTLVSDGVIISEPSQATQSLVMVNQKPDDEPRAAGPHDPSVPEQKQTALSNEEVLSHQSVLPPPPGQSDTEKEECSACAIEEPVSGSDTSDITTTLDT
ncbi:MAG: SMC-Scp complex subunit ScpB [Chitinivibrionales bacterium]|nr:SMC-Scp complex subunit ScpB [Chitinivibrionales bacterium]